MEHPQYTVKGLKTFAAHDGDGFEVTLYREGRRIGTVTDDGWGGGYIYHLEPGEEKALQAYATTLPIHEFGDGHSVDYDGDMVVWDLVEVLLDAQDAKKFISALVRKSKTNTVFVLDDENPEEGYRYVKAPWDEKVEAYLRKTYTDKGQRVRIFDTATKQFRDI